MIIVALQGGLGNQLFQYACARGLSAKTGAPIAFDLSGFAPKNGITPRRFALNAFALTIPVATEEQLAAFTSTRRHPRISAIKRALGLSAHTYYKEDDINFHPEVFGFKGDVYLEGTWQSEKYFSYIAGTLRSEIVLKDTPSKQYEHMRSRMLSETSISLHIRRTDYVNSKNSGLYAQCSIEYYQNALAWIAKSITIARVYIFSDDIQWVKENLHVPFPITYVSGGSFTDAEELLLMSACTHHIIANSSFSWWGAWLDPRPSKKVIAPHTWLIDPKYDTTDIVPSEWITI